MSKKPYKTDYLIGKIPGYNGKIDDTGKYQKRLLNNITRLHFSPMAYNINLSAITTSTDDNNKTTVNPIKSNVYTLSADTGFKDSDNQSTLLSALIAWNAITNGLDDTFKNLKNKTCIDILATNDSTINESLSNNFEPSVSETFMNELKNKSIFKMIQMAKDTTTSMSSTAGISLLSKVDDNNGFLNLIAGKALNIQTALPEVWTKSDYQNQIQCMIKLVSPSGAPEDVRFYIEEPLMMLMQMSAPVTKTGIYLGYPPLWKIEADGLMGIKIGAISNMVITRGGIDTQFNKYNQPTNVNVRLTITPLVKAYANYISNITNTTGNNPTTIYTRTKLEEGQYFLQSSLDLSDALKEHKANLV